MFEFTYEFDEAKTSFWISPNSDIHRKWLVICEPKIKDCKKDFYAGRFRFIDPVVFSSPEEYPEAYSLFNPEVIKQFDEYINKIGNCDFTKKGLKDIKDDVLNIKFESMNYLLSIIATLPSVTYQDEFQFITNFFKNIVTLLATELNRREELRKQPGFWDSVTNFFSPSKKEIPPTTVAPAVYMRSHNPN